MCDVKSNICESFWNLKGTKNRTNWLMSANRNFTFCLSSGFSRVNGYQSIDKIAINDKL